MTTCRKFKSAANAAWPNGPGPPSERVLEAVRDPTGKFDNLLQMYSGAIEPVCKKLGLPLRGGVACGVVVRPSDVPAQQPVPGTNASIIVIPHHTLMLCHFVSKALAWSFPISEAGERFAVSLRPNKILKRMRHNDSLRRYLAGAVAYFATRDGTCFSPYPNTTGACRAVWAELLVATEIFVMAHEYGHHVDEHSSGGLASVEGLAADASKVQEFRADYFGALITAHVGATMIQPSSVFAASGVAAVIVFAATDLVRRARSIFETGRERPFTSDTHPPLMERLIALERLNPLYDPRNRKGFQNARRNFRHLMAGLWVLIEPEIKIMRERGVRLVPLRPEDSDWLPP